MIVIDANVIIYSILPGAFASTAERVAKTDADWHAPLLWRSEVLNALAGYSRRGIASNELLAAFSDAELLIGTDHIAEPERVLQLVSSSTCSSYDCEYVAVAEALGAVLVTEDRKILREFPTMSFSMSDFLDL